MMSFVHQFYNSLTLGYIGTHRKSARCFQNHFNFCQRYCNRRLGLTPLFFFLVPAFDSRMSYTPVVTLISETRDVTLGRRGREKMPTRYLPFLHSPST